ncbi:LLM class F420-dependent oxidoreductase [Streptomyces sp. NPDC020719]|uniref:LLM class F420-dependent oxidoreductase n=1 Tax=Streptomyces sp. NPDC020719 TaxID=3154896 RepID=UPI0033CF957C
MKIGVTTFVTDHGIGPVPLGRAVEERNFESFFMPEHTHIPVSRESPFMPMTAKSDLVLAGERVPPEMSAGDLPEKYARTPDPLVALSAISAVTGRLLIGTGILLVAQRDPIILAKQVASLDHLSGGRFLFGVAAGWNREEMRNHGTDPRLRNAVLRERILAMKEIWTREQAEFHGTHVDFDPILSWPKPVSVPHPPILVGGEGHPSYRRAQEYGDGWAPIYGGDAEGLARQITRFRAEAEVTGAPVPPVTVFWAAADPRVLETLAAAGVERVLLDLPWATESDTLRHLDRLVAAREEFLGTA